MSDPCNLTILGTSVQSPCTHSLASAAANAGVLSTRISVGGERRGPLCGMGVCFECRATVNGEGHQRSCTVAAATASVMDRDGPSHPEAWPTTHHEAACDVLVIGAGPAGLAAANEAAIRGRSVIMLDDNAAPGGQIWRADSTKPGATASRARALAKGVTFMANLRVISRQSDGCLRAVSSDGHSIWSIAFRSMVIATGASELFLPFPGWTLPGVLGAGGAQAMCKQGLNVRSKRIVVAGSGPLLLAVGALLASRGAKIVAIAEQSPWSQVRGIVPELVKRPSKALAAAAMRLRLLGAPYEAGWWPVRAEGDESVRALVLTDGQRERRHECDLVACGFGLVPRVRLAAILGCACERGAIVVNAMQQTSCPNVFAAGECTGIGGVDKAVLEGRIAGASAAGDLSVAAKLGDKRSREQEFSKSLATAFRLRASLRDLCHEDTIVCRCEDITSGAVRGLGSWREAKLQTRLGMGPCQGCVCGPAADFLFGWRASDARPPILNTPLGTLIEPMEPV